ncbi:hypothetical protein [Pseudohoeflea coraliihabitans]|uniref:Uncharacterized protein n=1 Tax=Pseudohoeflea coraliihabitans TaxID=2860393 RepID=A0ABS6WSD1_9HYPH|nr:hypothetical protein [Pseudohoeflea sp. DP4N28-3]MBW3098867.1 hypothetical protein [Pseudohoeflea sp. DP4N28-3]
MSLWHWLIAALWIALFVIPLWRVLPRAGLTKWLALIGIVPFGAVAMWWILAFKQWPGDERKSVSHD